ncbi:hypothetical protein [Vitiosangium sp. GDMCC 1.1324]|uniref:hypothetical protein n=1 Tax=Vitiosangium sp. (strain GDMCC 1.1324) TaxID=2138576 RepID=UPI000D3591F8|nr:hypothetical protein [Vitiosangium sp. GDMCC 1.1324]PTL75601.1 hypothetical protein DAT35_54300 [Vitiosangium sp. GDMCC 1.1324]
MSAILLRVRAHRVELVSTEGVRLRALRGWSSEPLLSGKRSQLAVVAEATAEQLRGTFLLRLGETNTSGHEAPTHCIFQPTTYLVP